VRSDFRRGAVPSNATAKLATGTSRDSAGNLLWFTPLASGALSQSLPEITNSPTDITGQNDQCLVARPTSGGFRCRLAARSAMSGRNSYRGPRGSTRIWRWRRRSVSRSVTRDSSALTLTTYSIIRACLQQHPGNTCIDLRRRLWPDHRHRKQYFARFAEWNAATAIRLPVPLLTLQHPRKTGVPRGLPFLCFNRRGSIPLHAQKLAYRLSFLHPS